MALTGRVDVMDTLESVGRRGRAGPVEEGGPSERCAFCLFGWCAGSGVFRTGTKRACAGTGGELIAGTRGELIASTGGGRSSGRQRTSERFTSTGSTVTPWRFKSSTSTLG